MPSTQPAPAVPGNRAPLPPPSLRRPPPANVPRTPRPINAGWPKDFGKLDLLDQEAAVYAQLVRMRERARYGSPAFEALLHASVVLKLRIDDRAAQQ